MNANDERDYAEEAANAQLMRDEHENPDAMLADPWRLYPPDDPHAPRAGALVRRRPRAHPPQEGELPAAIPA